VLFVPTSYFLFFRFQGIFLYEFRILAVLLLLALTIIIWFSSLLTCISSLNAVSPCASHHSPSLPFVKGETFHQRLHRALLSVPADVIASFHRYSFRLFWAYGFENSSYDVAMQLTKEYKGVWSRHREPPELKAQERVDAILADIQTAAAHSGLREHEVPGELASDDEGAEKDVPCRFCKRKSHWVKNPMLLCDLACCRNKWGFHFLCLQDRNRIRSRMPAEKMPRFCCHGCEESHTRGAGNDCIYNGCTELTDIEASSDEEGEGQPGA
jgi:hypothetical protein